MRLLVCLTLWLAVGIGAAAAQTNAPQSHTDDPLRPLVAALETRDRDAQIAAADAVAASADPRAAAILTAFSDGDLYARKSDGAIFQGEKNRRTLILTDPFTSEPAGEARTRDMRKLRADNPVRRHINGLLGALALFDPSPDARAAAAREMRQAAGPETLPTLARALNAETDPNAAEEMRWTRAALTLRAPDAAAADQIAAVETLRAMGGQEALSLLVAPDGADPAVAEAVIAARAAVEQVLQLWSLGQNLVYGLSLGSVLLLAAIGLAITFGVMGVINMAHGELIMIGAYATFLTQDVIRNYAPGLFDWSLLIAIPVAFLMSGAVGVLIERGVVRRLYGRPLETLLATWGVSLILQQVVRSLFGPTNQEVGAPSWMSGAFMVGELSITWTRFWIFVFALVVLAALLIVLRRTRLGLEMRAVTQNRAMARNMGVRSGRVDALTFGLGAGVAGLAGVALSQIDNVSPNLGQMYIIDSFMVVVFGGAGNLWGAVAGAFTLGVAGKLLEPWAGAVLGKVLILIGLILFIQKRPRGMFPVRGRAAEH